MAAKSKKRLHKIENKLENLQKLELKDVYCSICQSILVEPVTLPCFHDFCKRCFNGSIENNALCCPLCRLRIGSWLRRSTKQKTLLNAELWSFMKTKFPKEIEKKLNGEDVSLPLEIPKLRLSEPGEIRREYETELLRLRTERLRLEQLEETELLIKKLQEEENEAHKRYLEALKHDEMVAIKIQKDQNLVYSSVPKKLSPRRTVLTKTRYKPVKIDAYLTKAETSRVSFSTEDDSSTSSYNIPLATMATRHLSPEIVPTYSKLNKTYLEKKVKNVWNKENGTKTVVRKEDNKPHQTSSDMCKPTINSLVVSLPLPNTGILQHKTNVEIKSLETESVDSVRQELCYFKPIDSTTPTTFSSVKGLPLKVPGIRADIIPSPVNQETPPSRDQYLEALTRLRNMSLAQNLPSAFVLAVSMLRVKKATSKTVTRSKYKKTASGRSSQLNNKKIVTNKIKQKSQVDGISNFDNTTPLKRTRSMGSLNKDENELTPKKAKVLERKVSSERKPHLRSDTKKSNLRNLDHSPLTIPESINNNKVNLAVKNLSSPLKNCEVKKLLQEQLQIEKIIEQEKNDYELARKIEAEWNGRRQPRRGTIKRQVTINYTLRPAKKVKV